MIQIRDTIESTAVCQANFGWAYNKEGLSPCLLLAAVSAPCLQGVFITTPLLPGHHYDPPSKVNGTLNQCSCSWAAYNLMSACTACQGQTSSISTWPFYNAECGDLISNTTYWPSNVMIPSNHKIPFYAGHDPNQWSDQEFDVPDAQAIADKNNPDLSGSPIPNGSVHKATPIGAIVGGTIGGVVLVLALLLLFCICRRRRASSGVQEFPPHRPSIFSNNSGDSTDSRKRIMSVASVSSFGSVVSSQPHSPNTIYTYDGTMQSFSQFGAPSVYTTHPLASPSHQRISRVMSPAPTVQTIVSGSADHIQPFMLTDDSPDTLAHRRKEAAARGISPSQVQPVPDTIVTLPVQYHTPVVPEQQRTPEQVRHLRGVVEEEEEHQPRMTRDRSQSQPPAYDSLIPTPSETASSYDHAASLRERNGHSHRTHGSPLEKGSQDTETSAWTSIGGVTDSTIHAVAIANGLQEEPVRDDEETQTPRADPGRIARYRSVQSTVESRDHPGVEVA